MTKNRLPPEGADVGPLSGAHHRSRFSATFTGCVGCGHSDGVDRHGQCIHKLDVDPSQVAVWDDNHCGHYCNLRHLEVARGRLEGAQVSSKTISKVMSVLGRRGGKVGGKSTSKAKRQSSKDNLAKARASRWPKRKEGAE